VLGNKGHDLLCDISRSLRARSDRLGRTAATVCKHRRAQPTISRVYYIFFNTRARGIGRKRKRERERERQSN